MYLQHWRCAGILKINDLFDTQQNCFPSFDSFRNKFNVRCNFLQYFSLVNAIPQSWKKLLNCSLEQSSTPQILIEEMTCKKIYTKLLSLRSKPPPTCEKRLLNFGYQKDDLRKLYLLPFEVTKEVNLSMFPLSMMFQYKIIHNIRWVKSLLFKMKKEHSPRCPFCPADPTQQKFQIPKLGNSCKNFPNLGIILGKNWEWNYQNWENFGKLNHFQDHRKGIFWDNIIIIFSKLHFGNIMGIYPILEKNWDMNFLLCKNIGQKIGKILSQRK